MEKNHAPINGASSSLYFKEMYLSELCRRLPATTLPKHVHEIPHGLLNVPSKSVDVFPRARGVPGDRHQTLVA